MPLTPVNLPPGVVKVDSEYSQEGRWTDSNKVRFVRGRPEKYGGYTDYDAALDAYDGTSRGLIVWNDLNTQEHIAIGTTTHLYEGFVGTLTDITPAEATGTLTTAFDTTLGSPVVTVDHVAHGRATNDLVVFSNGTAIGSSGITLDGEYTITVSTDDIYTVTHGSNAASNETNQGNADYDYLISPGETSIGVTSGFGAGTFGSSTFGTARSGSSTVVIRHWSLDNYGEDLIANPSDDKGLYQWDKSAGGRAAVITNAPTDVLAFFITEQRNIIALRDDLIVEWCDTEDNTIWAAAADATNNAGSRRLHEGNVLRAGVSLRAGASLIFTDETCHLMQYIGGSLVYQFRRQGGASGAIGPRAVVEFQGLAYWMSNSDFLMWNAGVVPIPNQLDIRDWVFDNLNDTQKIKVVAGKNEKKSEIIFIFPSGGSSEPDTYVIYHVLERIWAPGTFDFTAWFDEDTLSAPVVALNGTVFQMEAGLDADGVAMQSYLQSSPFDIGDGDQIMDIYGWVADVQRQVGDLTLTVTSKPYPGSRVASTTVKTIEAPVDFGGDLEYETRVDFKESGKQMAFRVESNEIGGDFRFGKPRVDIQPGGRKRGP